MKTSSSYCLRFTLLFFLIFTIKTNAQEKFMLSNNISVSTTSVKKEFVDFLKAHFGVYDSTRNYNKVINGHQTGLRPPSETGWKELQTILKVTDKIITSTSYELPTEIDWTKSKYFPPIGEQYGGTCLPYAIGYYAKSFSEAKEKNLDINKNVTWDSVGNVVGNLSNNLYSPYFIYNLVNMGRDNGSNHIDIYNILQDYGAATFSTFVFNWDFNKWPEYNAWKEAPYARINSFVGLQPEEENGNWLYNIDEMKKLLASGTLINMSVDAGQIDNKTVTLDNYHKQSLNHAVTIVGYDDNYTYTENGKTNHGAFKIVNSWGIQWGENGCFWASYNVVRTFFMALYLIDKINYHPIYLARFNIKHDDRSELKVVFNYGKSGSSLISKKLKFFPWIITNQKMPDNDILIDVTEFKESFKIPNDFQMQVTDQFTPLEGVINSFSLQELDTLTNNVNFELQADMTPINTMNGSTISIPLKPILLIGPEEGKKLIHGSNYKIIWNSICKNKSTKIEYSTNCIDWILIDHSIDGSCQYNWNIPNISSKNCALRISFEGTEYEDRTRHYFEISGTSSISISSPTNNSSLTIGSPNRISWSKSNLSENVNIFLAKNYKVISEIAKDIGGSDFVWTPISIVADSNYQIVIESISKSSVAVVDKILINSSIKILYPVGGEKFSVGNEVKINSIAPSGINIKVMLKRNSEVKQQIFNGTQNGYIEWVIGNDIYSANDYYIQIESYDGTQIARTGEFEISSCKLIWKSIDTYGFKNGFAIANNMLIYGAGSPSNNVYADDIFTGKHIWSFTANCFVQSSISINNTGQIFFASSQTAPGWEKFFSLNLNGEKKYSSNLDLGTSILFVGGIAINNLNQIYTFGTMSTTVFQINGNNGVYRSFIKLDNPIDGGRGSRSPSIDTDNNIYVADDFGVYAIDSTGILKWKYYAHPAVANGLTLDVDGTLYLTIESGGLLAIDENGKLKWENANIKSNFAPIIGLDRRIYVSENFNISPDGQYASKLTAIDCKGNIIWSKQLDYRVKSAPVIAKSGNVLIIDNKPEMLAFDTSGNISWKYDYQGIIDDSWARECSSPTIDDNGNIYILDNNIFVIKNKETGLANTAWPKMYHDNCNTSRANYLLRLESFNTKNEYKSGNSYLIKWRKSKNISSIDIHFSINGGTNWQLIEEKRSNDSTYNWTIPAGVNSNNCLLRIASTDNYEFFDISDLEFTIADIVNVDEEKIPTEYSLSQNYPNPFNPITKIKFGLPENATTKLAVYDILGREVAVLVNRELNAGYHEVNFDASNLSSGIYFYRIKAGEFNLVKKMLFMK